MMIGVGLRFGRSSIIMEKVSHKFARANQEKTREKTLYCECIQILGFIETNDVTHQSLNVEEEHANNTMAGFVEPEEMHESVH